MKKRNPVNNGHLTGMSQEEILADVLSHTLVYIEARNSFDNNKDYPLKTQLYLHQMN